MTELQIPENQYDNYSIPFTPLDLQDALDECKGSSAGPDMIHYNMIKNLKLNHHLLAFYNKIYTSGTFPENWSKAILILILKPGKDPKMTSNYRPISLTNCLCKILERMINKRLQWFLETNNIVNRYQSGFRKNRSTSDNLLYLESEIMESFCSKKLTLEIFFDLQKAYDTVWKRNIIQELLKTGLKGNMVKFISNFLTGR